MDEEIKEIIEKFDNYMDKKGISIDGKHNISKYMTEIYWEEIKTEGEEVEDDEEDLDLLDDIDDDQGEEEVEDDEEDLDTDLEDKVEKPKMNVNSLIKKHKAKLKNKKVKVKNGDN